MKYIKKKTRQVEYISVVATRSLYNYLLWNKYDYHQVIYVIFYHLNQYWKNNCHSCKYFWDDGAGQCETMSLGRCNEYIIRMVRVAVAVFMINVHFCRLYYSYLDYSEIYNRKHIHLKIIQ